MKTGKIMIASSAYMMTSGLAWSLLGLADYLKKNNVDFCVLLPRHGDLEANLKKACVPCKVIYYHKYGWYERINKKHIGFAEECKNKAKVLINQIALFRIKKYIAKEKINLIHINALTDDICARAAIATNTKFIWHIREFMEEDLGIQFCDRDRAIEEMNHASRIIAVSEGVRDKFQPLTNTAVSVIYNGIDFEKLYVERDILKQKNVTICIVGRITPQKGQHHVVEAVIALKAKGFQNIKAQIIGAVRDQNYMDNMKNALEQNNCTDSVEFIPFTEHIEEYYKAADIVCVCSEKEAFGRVTVEGMASGACVIGMNTGGTKELLDDGRTGFLYDNVTVKLAEKIEQAICSPALSNEIAKNGQKWVKNNFTSVINARRIYNTYIEVLDE